jgi:hypothetical protein
MTFFLLRNIFAKKFVLLGEFAILALKKKYLVDK